MLDASGNVIGRQAHLPFGEQYAESGTQEKHHFTSYESESESGTDYAVNRQYSPSVGRFGSADPYQASSYLVNPQSWNRYSYVENDPIHNVDPLGLLASYPEIDPCCSLERCGGDDSEPAEPIEPTGCTTEINFGRVSLSNKLRWRFGDPTALGTSFINSLTGDPGVEFRSEAHFILTGAFRGTAAEWTLYQTQELLVETWVRAPNGELIPDTIYLPPGTDDGTLSPGQGSLFLQREQGASEIFHFDAPGTGLTPETGALISRVAKWNLVTWAEKKNGRKTCAKAKWHVEIVIRNGMVHVTGGLGHIPIR